MVNLAKGVPLDLKKSDGSNLAKARVGLSWDVSEGKSVDLDLFVIAPDKQTVAFYNQRDAIVGVQLSEDNRTGEGEGDDEFVKMDATQTSDGVYTLALNIFDAVAKGQSFADVKNAKATVYNDETNDVLGTFEIAATGGTHTALIVGTVTDSGNSYVFTPKGDYIDGDINQVVASL